MFIKTVIIDGFKSYGKRTEVTGFDPEFTAITGLNGTGKSNVLDSICFVLGISNLGQVRATSLQELVYKGGQCGVTKATVTIIFDNTNPHQSPMGYEKCQEITVARQVVVGGKNKYLINGKTVLNKRVTDLFCSVQLNINNPNFLIMQGRITKVLNMKADEILSMIEEAAGTSMYETKREETNRMIEKKDGKIKEINMLIGEEIQPKLEKLRQDKDRYTEYQKLNREIEYLNRIHISHQYLQFKKAVDSCEKTIAAAQAFIGDSEQEIVANERTVVELDEQARTLRERIDADAGGELADLEAQLTELTRAESAQTGEKKSTEQGLAIEVRNLKKLQKNVHDDGQALAHKEQEMATVGGQFEQLKQAEADDKVAFEAAKKRYDAVRSGLLTNEDGEATSLQDQLMQAKRVATESGTTIKATEMEVRQKSTRLRTMQGQRKNTDAAYVRDQQALAGAEREVARLEGSLAALNYEDGSLEALEQQRRQLLGGRRDVQAQWEQRNGYRYEFQYTDPQPNFDRTRVKGMVCMLFDVRNSRDALALSMLAGGNLYAVVTDTNQTSELILSHGRLQNRTVMIPMNKIQAGHIADETLEFARDLVGADNVWYALDLVEYDPSLDVVMRYIFGRTLICRNMEAAEKVTFHPRIRCRTITLEGDVLDPQGTLSGGAPPKGGAVLLEIAEVKRLVAELRRIDAQKQEIGQQMAGLQQAAQRFGQQRDQLEAKRFELENVRQRLAASSVQQHETECAELQAQLDAAQAVIEEAREQQRTAAAKAADLQAKLSDAAGYRERELKAASEAMQLAKKRSEKSAEQWSRREQEYETLRLQIDELRAGLEKSAEQQQTMQTQIGQMEQRLAAMAASAAGIGGQVAELKAQLKAKRDAIGAKSRELKAMTGRKEKLAQNKHTLQLEMKKKQKEIEKLQSDNRDGFDRLAGLEQEYAWIAEDKQFFGAKNTRYDYGKTPPQEARQKLASAQQLRKDLERNLNQKAMMALEREETHFKSMSDRKDIIANDKTKIQSIIVDLDDQKRQQVKAAYEVVSENFGNIFATLLPGAMARLMPAQPNDVMAGLIVRVGFNGLWKESLNELSGGQRSLVALSLILAMLKFKPAPLYILDEVDAALDMSHTQNIGKMLKMHFTNSQFIIVSLKDGMFNNANVLFKTKFENGVSAVTRTVAAHLRR